MPILGTCNGKAITYDTYSSLQSRSDGETHIDSSMRFARACFFSAGACNTKNSCNPHPCSTPQAEAYLSGPKFFRTSIYCPSNEGQSANEGVSQGNKPCHFKVSHCVICHGDLLPPQCIYDEQARYLHKNEILHSEKELARDERTRMRVHASITYRSITNIVCKHILWTINTLQQTQHPENNTTPYNGTKFGNDNLIRQNRETKQKKSKTST